MGNSSSSSAQAQTSVPQAPNAAVITSAPGVTQDLGLAISAETSSSQQLQNRSPEFSLDNTKLASLVAELESGSTVLHWAVRFDRTEDLKRFLNAGASCTSVDSNSETALDLACKNGREDVIVELVKAQSKAEGYARPEFWVVEQNKPEIILAVPDRFDWTMKDPKQRQTLVHVASIKGYTKVIAAFQKIGLSRMMVGVLFDLQDSDGLRPLHYAAKNSDSAVLKALLSAHVNFTLPVSSPFFGPYCNLLHLAIKAECVENVKILLGAGADPNAMLHSMDTAPLYLAITVGNRAILQALVEAGADCFKGADEMSPSVFDSFLYWARRHPAECLAGLQFLADLGEECLNMSAANQKRVCDALATAQAWFNSAEQQASVVDSPPVTPAVGPAGSDRQLIKPAEVELVEPVTLDNRDPITRTTTTTAKNADEVKTSPRAGSSPALFTSQQEEQVSEQQQGQNHSKSVKKVAETPLLAC